MFLVHEPQQSELAGQTVGRSHPDWLRFGCRYRSPVYRGHMDHRQTHNFVDLGGFIHSCVIQAGAAFHELTPSLRQLLLQMGF
jgi:hypothetical protein